MSLQHKYLVNRSQKSVIDSVKICLRIVLLSLHILCSVTACGTTHSTLATQSRKTTPHFTLNSQTIFCPYRRQELSNYLVLKTDQTNYDSGEIHQMKDYAQKFLTSPENMPSTLEWQAGTTTGENDQDGCFLQVSLVNTGDSPIQIQAFQVKTIQPPSVNNDSYRLVELCYIGATNPVKCTPQQ